MIERSLLAHQSMHAAHPGRELRVLDVEFDIDRKLTPMAVLTQVVRAQTLRLSHRRQHRFRAQLHIARRMAAGTRQLAVFGAGRIELEQLAQHRRSGLVHVGTNCHLHRF